MKQDQLQLGAYLLIILLFNFSGEKKSTLSTPVKSQTGFKLSIKSVQMTSYSDDDLIIISNVVKRNTKNDRAENMIMSTLWRIQYDGRL